MTCLMDLLLPMLRFKPLIRRSPPDIHHHRRRLQDIKNPHSENNNVQLRNKRKSKGKEAPTDNSASISLSNTAPIIYPNQHPVAAAGFIIASTEKQSESSEDADGNLPISVFRRQDHLKTSVTGKRKHDTIRQCYMCEGA